MFATQEILECPDSSPLEKLHEVKRSDDFEPCQPLQLGALDVDWHGKTTSTQGMTLAGLVPPKPKKPLGSSRRRRELQESEPQLLEIEAIQLATALQVS